MNITPHAPSLSVPTVVNPPTEGLRRDNQQREVITQVSAVNHPAAEKGVASDKERGRTPAQNNEQVDFSNLRKHSEHASSSIGEHKGESDAQQQDSAQQNNPQEKQTKDTDVDSSKEQTEVLAEQKIINQLKTRDKEVRQHELAHASTGGATTGAPSYSFEVGPDGKKYAVGGEVSVDLSSVSGNPQATITKMQKVHAAALAPANPSTQDTRVAASASRIILQAQSEILALQNEGVNQATGSQNSSIRTSATFKETQDKASADFDTFINQTLESQDKISTSTANNQHSTAQKLSSQDNTSTTPEQSNEVKQRSQRVESFYFTISQGYEKPDNFQFELTA